MTYNDLLKSQVFSKFKHKNETTKNLTINIDQEPAKPIKADSRLIKTTNGTTMPEERQKLVTNNTHEAVIVPPL